MHQANATLNAKTIRESGLMTVKDYFLKAREGCNSLNANNSLV